MDNAQDNFLSDNVNHQKCSSIEQLGPLLNFLFRRIEGHVQKLLEISFWQWLNGLICFREPHSGGNT